MVRNYCYRHIFMTREGFFREKAADAFMGTFLKTNNKNIKPINEDGIIFRGLKKTNRENNVSNVYFITTL